MFQGCLRRGPSCGSVNSSLGVLLTQMWRLQRLADSVLGCKSGTRVVLAQSCCVTWLGRRGGAALSLLCTLVSPAVRRRVGSMMCEDMCPVPGF